MDSDTTSTNPDEEITSSELENNIPAGCILKLDEFDPKVDWRFFSELDPVNVVPFRPKAGVLFLYEFQDPEEKGDFIEIELFCM